MQLLWGTFHLDELAGNLTSGGGYSTFQVLADVSAHPLLIITLSLRHAPHFSAESPRGASESGDH